MNNNEFNTYKAVIRSAIRQVLKDAPPHSLDEAGFPAYSHSNPIINWLFWQRLHATINYIDRYMPYQHVLDFGCGSGVMLPYLGKVSQQVTAMDINLDPLNAMKGHIAFPKNLEIVDAKSFSLDHLPAASFELIVATDVLEHVDDLSRTLRSLIHLLKPSGRLIVSGPTENTLYQIGRRVAGPEYSGEYHERGVAEIKKALKKLVHVEPVATLYWPIPLFELFVAVV